MAAKSVVSFGNSNSAINNRLPPDSPPTSIQAHQSTNEITAGLDHAIYAKKVTRSVFNIGSLPRKGMSESSKSPAQSSAKVPKLNFDVPNVTSARDSMIWEGINKHIGGMRGLCPRVRNRRIPTIALSFRKPSSEQYQYAKHQLNLSGRHRLAHGLERIVKGDRSKLTHNIASGDALDMWLSVQHARLRAHKPKEREQYHREQAGLQAINVLFAPMIVSSIAASQQIRSNLKEYTSMRSRPEYLPALNGFLRMLSSTDVSENDKLKIAKTLVDQHIRREGTIAAEDVREINHRARTAGMMEAQDTAARSNAAQLDVRKVPPRGTDETALYQAIIRISGAYLEELRKPEPKRTTPSAQGSQIRHDRPPRTTSAPPTLPPIEPDDSWESDTLAAMLG